MILQECYTLPNGVTVPKLGLGTWFIDDDKAAKAVRDAVKVGYRLIDTAQAYGNERGVGEGVRTCGLPREELFVTSKVAAEAKTYEEAARSIDETLTKMGLEYLDLMIIHSPQPWAEFREENRYFAENKEVWRALEDAYAAGKLRAIGVSNFYPHTLTNFCETVRIKPMVNQIETHPFFVQKEAMATMEFYHVVPEAWSPLGGGRYKAFDNETLKKIADAHNKTIGQVMLRWNVQRGVVVIPKSTHVERIKENADIFDFTLTDEEMNEITALDMGYEGTAIKHFDPEFVRMCVRRNIHD